MLIKNTLKVITTWCGVDLAVVDEKLIRCHNAIHKLCAKLKVVIMSKWHNIDLTITLDNLQLSSGYHLSIPCDKCKFDIVRQQCHTLHYLMFPNLQANSIFYVNNGTNILLCKYRHTCTTYMRTIGVSNGHFTWCKMMHNQLVCNLARPDGLSCIFALKPGA